jgi:hypothetical protein
MTTRAAISATAVPPLEPGDHLTRDEFERRYEAMPEHIKAELIEGVVYMAPPAVRWDYHGSPHADLIGLLVRYRASTPGVRVGDNSSIRLDLDNEPQPDAAMVIEAACGGQAKFGGDGLLEGAPEFIGEVSATTVSIDMNSKLRSYRRNAVREYLVWRVRERAIDWFSLKNGQFAPLPRAGDIVRSEVFPGLWIDTTALANDDPATALDVLQQGLASREHAEFVAALKSRRGSA